MKDNANNGLIRHQLRCNFVFDRLLWWLSPLARLGIYLWAYLVSTEVYHGRLGSTRCRIRLFYSEAHVRVFTPLLAVEQRLRLGDPQFSGQVHNGCSLPPAEEVDAR